MSYETMIALRIERALLDQARNLRLNLSAICRGAIRQAIQDRESEILETQRLPGGISWPTRSASSAAHASAGRLNDGVASAGELRGGRT